MQSGANSGESMCERSHIVNLAVKSPVWMQFSQMEFIQISTEGRTHSRMKIDKQCIQSSLSAKLLFQYFFFYNELFFLTIYNKINVKKVKLLPHDTVKKKNHIYTSG